MINNSNKATATVDLRKAGTYTFKLTVTDNEGAPASKEVTVVVNPYTATENVITTFPGAVIDMDNGTAILDFSPNYVAGGSFQTSNINYTIQR
jgi:PKD repeat protein